MVLGAIKTLNRKIDCYKINYSYRHIIIILVVISAEVVLILDTLHGQVAVLHQGGIPAGPVVTELPWHLTIQQLGFICQLSVVMLLVPGKT